MQADPPRAVAGIVAASRVLRALLEDSAPEAENLRQVEDNTVVQCISLVSWLMVGVLCTVLLPEQAR